MKEIKEKDRSIPIVGEKGHHHHLRNLISASSAPSVIPNPSLDFSFFLFFTRQFQLCHLQRLLTLFDSLVVLGFLSSLEFLLINPDFDPREFSVSELKVSTFFFLDSF